MKEISSESAKKSKVYITKVNEKRKAQYRRMAVFIVRHPVVKTMRKKIVTKRDIHGFVYAVIAGLSVVTLMSVISTMQILIDESGQQKQDQRYDPVEVAQQQNLLFAQDHGDAKPLQRSIPIRRNFLPTLPITLVRVGPQKLLVTTQGSDASQSINRGEELALEQVTQQQEQVPPVNNVSTVVSQEEEEAVEPKKEEKKEEEKIDPNRLNPIDKKGEWDLVYFDKQSFEVDEDTDVEFDTNICSSMVNLGNGHEDVWCTQTSKLKDNNAASVGRDKCPSDCNVGEGCALWNTKQKKDEFNIYISNYLCL